MKEQEEFMGLVDPVHCETEDQIPADELKVEIGYEADDWDDWHPHFF